MQRPTGDNVLGNFNGAELTHFGVVTRFFRAGEKFMVHTVGPDGVARDYEVAYTFGVSPLQQYLVAFPGGRYQAFGFAWDSRPKEQNGQRWFHLYPDQDLRLGDPVHWTGRDQTWNYQCAGCHSTNLQKNYDLATDTYATSWTDLNVACEACHGPGSRHVDWALTPGSREVTGKGLTTQLAPAGPGHWRMNLETGIAARVAPPTGQELDVCFPCHARRKPISENPSVGAALLDVGLPALLESGLYHADGQIDGEVFEYGSYLQSPMYRAGVMCSDCHEPHTSMLRARGNALCGQCHLPAKFDTASHHHHRSGGAGAQCVDCHMPAKTYMGVDERRDHGFRIPRPDLSAAIGTPNACTQCHVGEAADWAASKIADWFPKGRQTTPLFATTLHAGRTGTKDAARLLGELVRDRRDPAIVRASALALSPGLATPLSEAVVLAAIVDPSPLVRMAAARALPRSPSPALIEAILPLLSDRLRAVRVETARALAGIDPRTFTPERQTAFAAAYLELVTAEMVDAERPEAHLDLGLLETRLGHLTAAQDEYETALRLDPKFVPALANLADLERRRGRDGQGADYLRQALAIEPDSADVRHSLGLLLIRQKKYSEAILELRKAQELAPDNARYAYVYAVARSSLGERAQAMALLDATHRRHPANRDVLLAIVSIARDNGDLAGVLSHARKLAALDPTDMRLHMLVLDLERRQAR